MYPYVIYPSVGQVKLRGGFLKILLLLQYPQTFILCLERISVEFFKCAIYLKFKIQ